MPFRSSNSTSQTPNAVLGAGGPIFGLRVEDLLLELTIARPRDDGRYDLTFDRVTASEENGFLTSGDQSTLIAALEELSERQSFQRGVVAVSLDGDYCVTRVTAGTQEEVQRDLGMLAGRVPRYLQLGPGKKVTGGIETELEPGMFYAATGVVNGELIEMLYTAFNKLDLEIAWVEPSLNSLARLVGRDPRYAQSPVLIADGTGRRWDVGIANAGRLLLDYRSSNSDTIDGLFIALDGHLERLRRFCQRHRKLTSGNIEHMLVCGNDEKIDDAVAILGRLDGIKTEPVTAPDLSDIFVTTESIRSDQITAVAAILPLAMGTPREEVPDLLEQIRRAPQESMTRRIVSVGWPLIAACLFALVTLSWRDYERRQFEVADSGRNLLESELNLTQVQFASMASRRRRMQNLERIETLTRTHDWARVYSDLTHCLPPTTKLISLSVTERNRINVNGETLEDSSLYDLIGSINQISDVKEVALKGTEPTEGDYGSRFMLEVRLEEPTVDDEPAVDDEPDVARSSTGSLNPSNPLASEHAGSFAWERSGGTS